MTKQDIAVLIQQDLETLCFWHCVLNSWEWPDEIPNPEPREQHSTDSRRSKIMLWIMNSVGFREINRYWNCCYLQTRMTHEEWNDFWRGSFEGHEPSRARYERRARSETKSSHRSQP